MRRRRARRHGFTLVEMMVVISIIALLSMLAIPHYHSSLFRAQRTEAVIGLEGINTMQIAYYMSHDEFAPDFPSLSYEANTSQGPSVMMGNRYTYTITRPWGDDSYFCTASADLDKDPWPDIVVAFERFN